MKTISILVKKSICNLLIFLVSVQATYSLVSHFVYGKPQPDYLELIICLLIATFASSKIERYNKQ